MHKYKMLIPFLICILLLSACDYIVFPEEIDTFDAKNSKGWTGIVTSIGKGETGALHIDLTIRNETGVWSTIQSAPGKPALLTNKDGATISCDTVMIGSGKHRIAPGFQMRGYTAGTKKEPKTQLLYVECKDAEATAGSKLTIDYDYFTGELNYYDQEANKASAVMEINLDKVVQDLQYPIAEPVDDLLLKPEDKITALNDCFLNLPSMERSDKGIVFHWQTENPGEYPTYVHIGTPPVIGDDGIVYGIFEIMDLVSVPITPAGAKAEWTTEVSVPENLQNMYVLLSVESKKQRLYINYAVDINQ